MPDPTARLLVVDTEVLSRRALSRVLGRSGLRVETCAEAAEGLERLRRERFDALLVDVGRGGAGLELVRAARQIRPGLRCVVMSDETSPPPEAPGSGPVWFVPRPRECFDALREVVARACAAQQNGRVQTGGPGFERIVGSSPALQRVLDCADKVAASSATVLITGESGTGKELFARAIHERSPRAGDAFVAVNCGAIPEDLLESELFGHMRGAFTHAIGDRVGRFELADGGTIFLDEIGDMSPSLQVKLLRVLEDGGFEAVGSSDTRRVDVRVIAATNQKLEQAMQEGRFRRDLFYRLNVVPIELPPLRERRDDVPRLARFFLRKLTDDPPEISDAALACLSAYDWPGNVRELENLIERTLILRGPGPIDATHLPESLRCLPEPPAAPLVPETGLRFGEVVARFEADLIRQALEHTDWNKSQAARLLGLNRTTMLEMIKKRGVTPAA